MIKPAFNNRGVALLVTLTVVTVLISVAVTLNRQMRTEAITGNVYGQQMVLAAMAESGIQAGMAMLAIDKMESTIDSIQENWADADYIKEALEPLNFDDGKLEVVIHDELSRIQVNALVIYPQGRNFNPLQQRLWIRFLEALSEGVELYDGLEPAEVINPVKDWLDRGDDDAITGLSGAESDYYLDQDPPYSCRNGPMQYVEELALVKGVTGELFNGLGEILGITHYMTVYGATAEKAGNFTFKGNININTAELPVIAALLPLEQADLAQQMVEYRSTLDEGQFIHDLSQPLWYKNVPGMQNVTIDPALITLSSDLFRIDAIAANDIAGIRITSLVQREKNKETGRWFCRILNQQQGPLDPKTIQGNDETALLNT